MIEGFFVPVYERVSRKLLEDYEEEKFREQSYPQELLIEIEVKEDD